MKDNVDIFLDMARYKAENFSEKKMKMFENLFSEIGNSGNTGNSGNSGNSWNLKKKMKKL